MSTRLFPAALAWLIVIGIVAEPAFAGMPSFTLTEVAEMRLEGISFFLLGLLVSAFVVLLVWNSLSHDFTWLPKLTFFKACGIVTLWGLLFVVVLTMISGARELMTPGAWEKQGATYKLRQRVAEATASEIAADSHLREARRRKLALLGSLLNRYAMQHEGNYPANDQVSEIPAEAWNLPDLPGTRYVYVPGRTDNGNALPLAYEPTIYDGDPLVLLTSGQIVAMTFDEIVRQAETGP